MLTSEMTRMRMNAISMMMIISLTSQGLKICTQLDRRAQMSLQALKVTNTAKTFKIIGREKALK